MKLRLNNYKCMDKWKLVHYLADLHNDFNNYVIENKKNYDDNDFTFEKFLEWINLYK